MGKTTSKIIIALAVVFVAIAVYQSRRNHPADPEQFQARSLFSALDLAAVASVQIERAGESVTLRRAEGDHWGVEQRGGYAVDREKLRRLALGMAQLQARDRLTADPEKYALLGLAEPPENGTVTLLNDAGNALATLRLGTFKAATGAGGSSGQFVRAGEDPAVYRVASAPTADTDATAWVDRKLLDLAADQVMRVEVARAGGGFTAARRQPSDPLTLETALPKGRTADSSALGDLGRALVNLSCDDVLAADDGSTAGLAFDVAFAAESADGVRYTVALAEKDGKRYARLEAAAVASPATAATKATDGQASEPATAPAQEASDPQAAVKAFNQRHRGWTYTLPQYTYDRLDKSLENLLAAPTKP
jgi:hypothetical protein